MKRRIGIVACSKSKLPHAAAAADLYQGELFRLSKAEVIATCADWCILSAKYGVVLPDQVIEPYEQALRGMTVSARVEWALQVDADLARLFGREDVLYVVYAGVSYRGALGAMLKTAPLEGLGIGKQLQKLRQMQAARERADKEADFDGDHSALDPEEEDEMQSALDECHMLGDGTCMAAGSEYCDFECPFRDE
jgi:hypothetical protein